MCKESIFLYLWGELGVTWSAAGLTVESAPFRNRLIQVRWTGINSNVLAYKSAASICQRSTRCPGGEVWNTAAVFMCACDKETNKEKHFFAFSCIISCSWDRCLTSNYFSCQLFFWVNPKVGKVKLSLCLFQRCITDNAHITIQFCI